MQAQSHLNGNTMQNVNDDLEAAAMAAYRAGRQFRAIKHIDDLCAEDKAAIVRNGCNALSSRFISSRTALDKMGRGARAV